MQKGHTATVDEDDQLLHEAMLTASNEARMERAAYIIQQCWFYVRCRVQLRKYIKIQRWWIKLTSQPPALAADN
eukprot:12887735-Prorocentrum_lima.AAC.1